MNEIAESGSVTVSQSEEGNRLDTFTARVSGISRSKVQRLIDRGLVTVDGQPSANNHRLAAGERVRWENLPALGPHIVAQDIPLDIVYEDDHLVVVDKPPDMVMYPGPGHPSGTLSNALVARYPEMQEVGGRGRPGIFHRLDRDTSGLTAVARNEPTYQAMVEKMKRREVERRYLALVTGHLEANRGLIDAPMARSRFHRKRMAVDPISGRRAVTRFEVRERFENGFTLVDVSLDTGRTHQIRVHFAHIGHPVAGDAEYSRGRASRKAGVPRQFLHAFRLSFEHPESSLPMSFESRLPQDLEKVLEELGG